jgi:hypothetical protein
VERPVVWKWIEAAIILLAVLSLWPWILRWPHPAWRILSYVMLAAMGGLFVFNVVRLRRMGHSKGPDDEAR